MCVNVCEVFSSLFEGGWTDLADRLQVKYKWATASGAHLVISRKQLMLIDCLGGKRSCND